MVTNELIERPQYTDWLQRWKDRDVIKVITGLRRCGKSMVLELFRRSLVAEGIAESHIISINFESLDAHYPTDYQSLYDYIVERLQPNCTNYVFLDEVQHVEHFEKAADGLYVRDDVDLYITGSKHEICFPANWQHSSPDDMSNLRCCHCLSRNTEMHCNQQQMTMRCSTGISHMEDSPTSRSSPKIGTSPTIWEACSTPFL